MKHTHRIALLSRWAARLLGTPLALMVFLDFATDATQRAGFPAFDLFRTARLEHFLLDVVLLASLGLLLAWRYETAGGWLATAGGVIFLTACVYAPGMRPAWGLGLALALPGLLYLTAAHEEPQGQLRLHAG